MSRPPATLCVAFDLESAGGTDDEIIEIGAVKFRGDEVMDRFQTLVRPRRPPTVRVQQLTGIPVGALQAAPSFDQVRDSLAAFIENLPLVAHSVHLDRDRLQRQGLPLANVGLDTYELAGILLPRLPSYSLAAVAAALAVTPAGLHRALADAETTRGIFLKLFEQLLTFDPRLLLQINELLTESAWPLRLLVREAARIAGETASARPNPVPRRPLESDALPLFQRGSTPALEPAAAPAQLDLAALRAVWSASGPLARGFPNYERRPQQEEMSAAIAGTFNDGGRMLIEAGTGTGKTLAYLLPAAQWALQNGERVVISTNTVNLQDQIEAKDVPDLQRALGAPFLVHILKGRSNYLCLLRWAEFRARRPGAAPLSPLESRVLVKVLLWLEETASGDVTSLNLVGDELALWAQISATRDTCTNDACVHKQRRTCFLFNARRAADAAHLVVVNHALLLSDVAADNGILPEYEHLILDEAHHLEEQGTRHFAFDLPRRELFAWLVELFGSGDPQRPGGLTQVVRRLLPNDDAGAARALERLSQLEGCADRAHRQTADFFTAAADVLGSHPREALAAGRAAEYGGTGFERTVRVRSELRAHPRWPRLVTAWTDLSAVLAEIQQGLERLAQTLAVLPADQDGDWERHSVRMAALTRRLVQIRQEVGALIAEPDANRVYWFSLSQGDQPESLSIHSAPLNVGELLDTLLFAPRRTVVLTSATLTVKGCFTFVRDRVGLTPDDRTLQIGSPFDYPRQAMIYLPEDLVDPALPAFGSQVNAALVAFATASRGRCLVLFTAHAALRATYRAIKEPLEQLGIAVVAQGIDGSRSQLLQTLRSHAATVVLGSASFWEGVDLAGEALSALAIVRLPFTVPTDPVFAARCEQFSRPFDEYSLPQAVLRFKQGFGRLIRTATDRGVLLILDRRVTSKYYGQQFLRSLPACTVQRGRLAGIGPATAAWLAAGEPGPVVPSGS